MENIIKSEKENYNYLQTSINPLFQKIYKDLLIDKPANLIDYLIDWLQKEKKGENHHRNQIFDGIKIPEKRIEKEDVRKKVFISP